MIKYFFIIALCFVGLVSCSTSGLSNGAFGSSPPTTRHTDTQSLLADPQFWQGSTANIWDKLTHTALPKLQTALSTTQNSTNRAWLQLAIINKQHSSNTPELIRQLMQWRKENSSHPANALFPDDTALTRLLNTPAPKHIALLLPLEGQLSTQGQVVREGFLSAYYESSLKNQQTVSFYDTNKNPNIVALYQQALQEGADIVVGPLSKEQVQMLLKQSAFSISTLALNYTDIYFGTLPTNFYEFGLSPVDEAQQVADKAWQAGQLHALVIAPQSDWGQRIAKPLIARWQALGGKVSDTYYFTDQANLSDGIANLLHINQKEDRSKMQENNNKDYLQQQRRQDFDVILLIAQPQAARAIVPLLKYYYAGDIPIYAPSTIYTGAPDPQLDSDLNGVHFCDIPWIFKDVANGDKHTNRLYAVGLDAYLLSNALPRLSALSNFPLYAATGALSLNSKNQIYRRLPWTQMHAGHP